MRKEIGNQVQQSQRVSGSINPRRNTPRHIVAKLIKIKDKDKILKETGKDNKYTKGLPSGYQQISQHKLYKPEGNGVIYLK